MNEPERPDRTTADPSTRAGFTYVALTVPLVAGFTAFVAALLITGLLVGWQEGLFVGLTAALVIGVVAGLLASEREDGRIEQREQDGKHD